VIAAEPIGRIVVVREHRLYHSLLSRQGLAAIVIQIGVVMAWFVVVSVMVSGKVLIQLSVEPLLPTHSSDHAGNILHLAKQVSPRTTLCESRFSVFPGSPTFLVPAPIRFFRSHETYGRIV